MIIKNPVLPPKNGYVEDEVNGIRGYRSIQDGVFYKPEELRAVQSPSELEQLRADIDFIAMETGVEL